MLGENGQQRLSIEDPFSSSNDIGNSANGIKTIKNEFRKAYFKLQEKVSSTNENGDMVKR